MDHETSRLYDKSLHFLSFRCRSVSEMKFYLKKNKANSNQIEEIIQKLKNLNLLNDYDFAQRWIDDRLKFHPRSSLILRMELKRKGISQQIIDQIILSPENASKDLSMAKNIALKMY